MLAINLTTLLDEQRHKHNPKRLLGRHMVSKRFGTHPLVIHHPQAPIIEAPKIIDIECNPVGKLC